MDLQGLPSALWGLLRLGIATRFRLRGRYWRWRDETAFGLGRPGRAEQMAATLDYARWTTRMRRIGRARAAPVPDVPGGRSARPR